MSVRCSQCGQEWERDPALEVKCPQCHAKPGHPCVARRPSGHVHRGWFAGLIVHPTRDLLAMEKVPGYGHCPKKPQRERALPLSLPL